MSYKQAESDIHYTRILWRAHRGMLELDLFLIPFIKEQWFNLSEDDKYNLEQLLQCHDPELYSWLMGHEVPAKQEFFSLVQHIRHHKKTTS